MRIAVFGSTGMVGANVVAEALDRGHDVDAVSRNPVASALDRLTGHAVDVADRAAVAGVLSQVDAAVLTIRLAPGEEHQIAPLTQGFLEAAAGTRVLIVGGSAPLRTPNDPGRLVIDDPRFVPEQWQPIARASLAQFHVWQEFRDAGAVYLSPPAVLEPGVRAGRYRRGGTTLLVDADGRSAISAADLAIAVVDELEQPCREPHFTVAQL
ncbi:NADH-flavin reductase [Enemella dayhoffiae]|uniref:NADH-flavin reductase n=1 Tax=Enemella dayhoffiae TaxID=2016507 RepID=A0A255GYC3_9ACTN|nr:NAD(P)H-binding protein [Enemella dayhoffiae]OYO18624.1 NADH-flavin reductase [Enemella dayhoffiae]